MLSKGKIYRRDFLENIMIFIAVGTQKFQFNRLLQSFDYLIESGQIEEKVFAQVGYSDYIPQNYQHVNFLDSADFEKYILECSILVTHSGVGTIVTGLRNNKKIIVVPRQKRYGEHIDNHQIEIAEAFSKSQYVQMCMDENMLYEAIEITRKREFIPYISQREKTVMLVENYLSGLER